MMASLGQKKSSPKKICPVLFIPSLLVLDNVIKFVEHSLVLLFLCHSFL